MPRYLEVAFNVPVDKPFTYQDVDTDPDAESVATPFGARVVAQFGRRKLTGFVVGIPDAPPPGVELRSIARRIDDTALFDEPFLELARWLATTYLCSVGEALSAMLPSGRREVGLDDIGAEVARWQDHQLTEEQLAAVAAITGQASAGTLDALAPAVPLFLRGVTGSGKTAVFLESARECVAGGRGVIYLVPEISLTHQVVDVFRDVFGDAVAVIHSALTPSQRLTEWARIRSGQARVVIGARSAVFAPVSELGLIVIDEEHEPSYKSAATPRYHARQVAMHRCRQEGATLVMGSATPSLEALHHMGEGRLRTLNLTRRPGGGQLPEVRVVDMQGEKGPISGSLAEDIRAAAADGRQSILFLNRRGFSYFFHCRSCGHEMQCANCSVSLTYHKQRRVMLCHYCGFRAEPMHTCPECRSLDVGSTGYGTQRIEDELAATFPDLRVRRLDADSTRSRHTVREVLAEFRERSIDILVGTQMVAKGLDFPGVKLVGIVNADTGLHLPDFRAAERTFNLIVQVSGRAGRVLPDGRVVVQTRRPNHDAIRLAALGDAETFYRRELEVRRELSFPPFVRMVRVVLRGKDKRRTFAASMALADALQHARAATAAGDGSELLGPAECAIEKIASNYRYHLLLRGPRMGPLHQWVQAAHARFTPPSGVHAEIDVDPLSVM